MKRLSFESRLLAVIPEGMPVAPFCRFRDDLLRFNRGRNLVSRRGGQALIEDLILESTAAAGVLGSGSGRTLDLGSGAGFPGIPFALACPSRPLLLLDRRSAACTFLRREVVALRLEGVEVVEGQAREVLRRRDELRGAFELGMLKAVAPPVTALDLARPFLAEGGRVALFGDEGFRPGPEIDRRIWKWEGLRLLPEGAEGKRRRALQVFRRVI